MLALAGWSSPQELSCGPELRMSVWHGCESPGSAACLLGAEVCPAPWGQAHRSASFVHATGLVDPPGVLPGQGEHIKYLMFLLSCLGCSRNLPRHGSRQGEGLCVQVSEQKVARCEGSHVTLHLGGDMGVARIKGHISLLLVNMASGVLAAKNRRKAVLTVFTTTCHG